MSAAFSLPLPGSHQCSPNSSESFRAFAFAVLLITASVALRRWRVRSRMRSRNSPTIYSDTEEAVGVLATSGNPLAYSIISALQDGRLMADPETKKVFVTQPDGKIIDAATGAAVASVPDSAPPCVSTTSCAASSRRHLAA